MKIPKNNSELGACYSENIPEIAMYSLLDCKIIVSHLLACPCCVCSIVASDILQLASLGAWLEQGGRIAFIDPPEKNNGNDLSS